MPRRSSVYYGSYQRQRKRDGKKRFFIILALLVSIGFVVWITVFFGMLGKHDVENMTKDLVYEITELKLQLEEKDDEIEALNQKILEYEAELAVRPTIAPTPVPPPNETVMAGQPTPTPTAVPRRRTQATPAPVVQEQQVQQSANVVSESGEQSPDMSADMQVQTENTAE